MEHSLVTDLEKVSILVYHSFLQLAASHLTQIFPPKCAEIEISEERSHLSWIIWQDTDRVFCFSTQHTQHGVFLVVVNNSECVLMSCYYMITILTYMVICNNFFSVIVVLGSISYQYKVSFAALSTSNIIQKIGAIL